MKTLNPLKLNRIIQGNCLEILKTFPDEFVDTIITSPPYWGLRDYGEETKVVFGGDKKCKHKFDIIADTLRKATPGDKPGKRSQVAIHRPDVVNRPGKPSEYCSKCGAWYGQLGLEPTLDLFLEHLLAITQELKRVLKPTGVMFWNHGDCYGGIKSGKTDKKVSDYVKDSQKNLKKYAPAHEKCLMLQNYRLILKMIDDQGWILRNSIVWWKPNAMPSSVNDRFTNVYEPVFMLVKNINPIYYYNIKTELMADRKPRKLKENIDWYWETHKACKGKGCDNIRCIDGRIKESYWKSVDYWFDLDAVRITHKQTSIKRTRYPINPYGDQETGSGARMIGSIKGTGQRKKITLPPGGKNPGDVWSISTKGFPGAHFAIFPEKLVEPMIKSSCPQQICKKCGKARVRITKIIYKKRAIRSLTEKRMGAKNGIRPEMPFMGEAEHITKGWTDCDCKLEDKWEAGIVLDPFIGSGTVAKVARGLGRNWIGIELSKSYIKIAEKRLQQQHLGI